MLPKVANHIFLHTSRAVAAVQNQTSYTIRNVLQLQSSAGPSTTPTGLNGWNGAGSSSWGSNGTGPGGAKFNAGSRFYNGYTGAGRAVTQANTSTSQDGNAGQNDDREEVAPKRASLNSSKRTRMRRHSLSLGTHGRQERGETLGVLQTVQMHVRSRHAFATSSSNDSTSLPSRPPLVRRNSTAVPPTTSGPIDDIPPTLISSTKPSEPERLSSTDPAAPQSLTEPSNPADEESIKYSPAFLAIKDAMQRKDGAGVLREVQALRTSYPNPTIYEFNMALTALHETRREGEPITLLLETYNDMVQRSIAPNYRTYVTLILALTERDHEVYKSITSLETRMKRRMLHGRPEIAMNPADQKRIEQLKAENNFGSAMAMFEAAAVIGARMKINHAIYHGLLRSCAYHANVDAAIHVYAHLESRPDIYPTSIAFAHLLSVYTNAGDLHGAKEVFNEFKEATKAGRIRWTTFDNAAVPETNVASSTARSQLQVWNKMIEAYFRCGQPAGALRLLETMMDNNAGKESAEVPPPASSTFTHIIAGFCNSGDVPTALSWFDRLLQQGTAARHPFESSLIPARPDQIAWMVMLESLATHGMIEDLNRLFSVLVEIAARDGLEIRATDRLIVLEANVHYLESTPDITPSAAIKVLDFLTEHTIERDLSERHRVIYPRDLSGLVERLFQQYSRFGVSETGIRLAEDLVNYEEAFVQNLEQAANVDSVVEKDRLRHARNVVSSILPSALQAATKKSPPSLQETSRIMRLAYRLRLPPVRTLVPYHLHAYSVASEHGDLEKIKFSTLDHQILLDAALALEGPGRDGKEEQPAIRKYAYKGLAPLLVQLSKNNFQLDSLKTSTIQIISSALYTRLDAKQIQDLFAKLSPPYRHALENKEASSAQNAEKPSIEMYPPLNTVNVDASWSRYVDEWYPSHPGLNALDAYARIHEGIKSNKYPHPATIGRVINGLGRLRQLERVHTLYDIAQIVVASLEGNQHWQSYSWYQIEDQMVIACAHAGDMESAFAHRTRITENGGAPSPDAYGSLIECVKDTTDDTSNAMALFRESQMVGCIPNVYLYNTIISKLAKARKADYALELFQQMKATLGLRPSSITYGAVIAACARVGDAQSAEQLFAEMSSQANFKPRIPPYNTMMQLYTHTKPDRERVLYYYNALLGAGIQPSAHTYKLLIDAYGTIEPVDVDAMERVFKLVESSRSVSLQGSHWAALINAWGCVRKDLDRAIAVFQSIAQHPSSRHSKTPLPDAVTYEALINVLVTHKRMDLAPAYVDQLEQSGVHMTAYIANLLIKGYAAAGDVEQARDIFEGLADPPSGMAAPNNHVPHEHTPSRPTTPPSSPSPSYREPSTWEAMFRAELGNGDRDRAVALLERLRERQFPPAVYNRIRGIMLDDSVSPWPASES